jgi:tetratricopeptide (TPR) repeat protein
MTQFSKPSRGWPGWRSFRSAVGCRLLIPAVLLALWGGLAVGPAHGRHYVVDPHHLAARDTNPGSAQEPFRTLPRALKELQPYDTLLLKAGPNPMLLTLIPPNPPPEPTTAPRFEPPVTTAPPSPPQPLKTPPPSRRPAAPTQPFHPAEPGLGANWLIAGVVALVLLGGVLLFFLVILPRRRRRPLLQALSIIDKDERPRFPEAEKLLGTALIAGLRKRDIAETRFALAYVRARLGRYAEASAVLSDLLASGHRDRETMYLHLWLEARQKNHEQVERIFDEHEALLGDLLDTRHLVGIAFLVKAQLLWSRHQASGALEYYERLRGLDVLHEHIPSHLAEQQVMFGMVALFEKKEEEAHKHFEGAIKAAREEGRSTVPGELGLLLCQWRKDEHPDLDAPLGQVLEALEKRERVGLTCPHCQAPLEVEREYLGLTITCTGCRKPLEVEAEKIQPLTPAPAAAAASPEGEGGDAEHPKLSDDDLLRRNTILWHALALLITWFRLPPRSPLPAAGKAELFQRLDKVSAVDPAMGDPYLVKGLIGYYFPENDQEREEAVKNLEEAIRLEVSVPEVLNLLAREQRLAQMQQDALRIYLGMVRNYLADQGVPEHYRARLKERLERFSRFRELGEIDLVQGDFLDKPSVEDVMARAGMMKRRIQTIVRPRLARTAEEKAVEQLDTLLTNLDQATQTLRSDYRQLEGYELDLIGSTGEFLFREEGDTEAPPETVVPATGEEGGPATPA